MAGEVEFAFEDEKSQAFLKKILSNVEKVKDGKNEFAEHISPMVFADILGHFEEQKGPSGGWKAWSNIYSQHMAKIGKSGNSILQDTGHLRQMFTPKNYRSSGDGILWFNPAQTKDGFPYAAAHDEGGPKLPQREFMWLSKEAGALIERATLEFLEKGVDSD